jgi:transcription initiation factor TFIID subunit 6
MTTDASVNSMAGNMQGVMDSFSTQLGNPSVMQASSSGQMVECIPSAVMRRDQGSDLAQKVSMMLRQAWKEDQDAGHLLASLHEVFGEAIFSFVQPPEMSLFV